MKERRNKELFELKMGGCGCAPAGNYDDVAQISEFMRNINLDRWHPLRHLTFDMRRSGRKLLATSFYVCAYPS